MSVLLSASAQRDAQGNFLMIRTTLYDVTDRKRAEDEVRRLNAELEHRVSERTAELAQAKTRLARECRARTGRAAGRHTSRAAATGGMGLGIGAGQQGFRLGPAALAGHGQVGRERSGVGLEQAEAQELGHVWLRSRRPEYSCRCPNSYGPYDSPAGGAERLRP